MKRGDTFQAQLRENLAAQVPAINPGQEQEESIYLQAKKVDGWSVWRAGKSEHDRALARALEARNLPSVLAPRYVAC